MERKRRAPVNAVPQFLDSPFSPHWLRPRRWRATSDTFTSHWLRPRRWRAGFIGLVRRSYAFQNGRFEGRRFVELLPFKRAQRLADDIAFVGITTGVDKTVHELV